MDKELKEVFFALCFVFISQCIEYGKTFACPSPIKKIEREAFLPGSFFLTINE